jgi:hypothetical protein
MYRSGVKILKATVGIETNRRELLPGLPFKLEVKSLLTDFRTVEPVSYTDGMDGYIKIEDTPSETLYEFSEKEAVFKGSFVELTKNASDLRFSFWGNLGFLYRYVLYLLEKKHKIYNFHACALYHERKDALYVVIGGAGSGKTVNLLSGLEKGLKLFSTETVHFYLEDDELIWYKGSLADNVRYGTLLFDFPEFLPVVETPEKDKVWQKKISLDLSEYEYMYSEIRNPRSITILIPRIEEGRKEFISNPIQSRTKAAKSLFDNITQKLTETFVLYDRIPVLGFEESILAKKRLERVTRLVQHDSIQQILSILASPSNCWGNILD